MKSLFVSFTCNEGVGNACIAASPKIQCGDDIVSLQEYIEKEHGFHKVVVTNFRRME